MGEIKQVIEYLKSAITILEKLSSTDKTIPYERFKEIINIKNKLVEENVKLKEQLDKLKK